MEPKTSTPCLPSPSAIPQTTQTDAAAALLTRCAGGDRIAFRLLYDRWGSRLYGIALRITRQDAMAADATQDAFVQIWQQAHRFDPIRGSAEAWLIGILRYRALDIVRRRSREETGYEPEEREDEAPDALARLVSSAEGAALHRCLKELEEDRRRLVVLAFVEGLSHSELAARMNAPLGTVKSWIRRSLMSLRECLAS
jgi:RNA polymerase sigma-70 factor, ECF subfamily